MYRCIKTDRILLLVLQDSSSHFKTQSIIPGWNFKAAFSLLSTAICFPHRSHYSVHMVASQRISSHYFGGFGQKVWPIPPLAEPTPLCWSGDSQTHPPVCPQTRSPLQGSPYAPTTLIVMAGIICIKFLKLFNSVQVAFANKQTCQMIQCINEKAWYFDACFIRYSTWWLSGF